MRYQRKKPPKLHPTSIRLTEEMRDFLRDEAEKKDRFNKKFGTGDVTYIINEVLEAYRAHIQARRKRA